MYCRKCGKQIPDDSAFCPKCGASQGGSSPSGTEEIAEVEIEQMGVASAHFRLHAVAVGPQGEYLVISSEKFKAKPGPLSYYIDDGIRILHHAPGSAQPAINEVTTYMARNGWEPLPRGQYWYSYRYRRRAR
jgi:zinc-ribbon domain